MLYMRSTVKDALLPRRKGFISFFDDEPLKNPAATAPPLVLNFIPECLTQLLSGTSRSEARALFAFSSFNLESLVTIYNAQPASTHLVQACFTVRCPTCGVVHPIDA